MTNGCSHNTDPNRLVREGTAQDERSPAALDPSYAPVDGHNLADDIVFAQGFARMLNYFDANNNVTGDWAELFKSDVSVILAVPAIEDIRAYQMQMQEWFAFLSEPDNQNNEVKLKQVFGYIFASLGTLALGLDALSSQLPDKIALKKSLLNLISVYLAPVLKRLIACHDIGVGDGLIEDSVPQIEILHRPASSFSELKSRGLTSSAWTGGVSWPNFVAAIQPDDYKSMYGDATEIFEKINYCSRHALFREVSDQFLRVYSNVVGGAKNALNDTVTDDDTHEPHITLFLAFLRLLDCARKSANTLTQRHLDFYYRRILRLKEKSSEPGRVHLLAELAKQAMSREFKPGETFRAGKDELGKDVFFANESDVVANQAKIVAQRTLYRHNSMSEDDCAIHHGRIFASPIANSDDGLGAALTSTDGSWHPYFNYVFTDGELQEIRMPKAEIGFAIASHYLLMAGGHRTITLDLHVNGDLSSLSDLKDDIQCLLTTEKGWLEIPADHFSYNTGTVARRLDVDNTWMEMSKANLALNSGILQLKLQVDGDQPAIVPYVAKTHGYNFQTDRPMLLVKLKHDDSRAYKYSIFQGIDITRVDLGVEVAGLKILAASNDFGPVDASKPFQPFGVSPVKGSSFVVGSKEIFQKTLEELTIHLDWMSEPAAFGDKGIPNVTSEILASGKWLAVSGHSPLSVSNTEYTINNNDELASNINLAVKEEPDYSASTYYSTQSTKGYMRLQLDGDFGQTDYQAALVAFLRKTDGADDPGSKSPTGPVATSFYADYKAKQEIKLGSSDQKSYDERLSQFFHLAPFGTAEQHPYLQCGGVAYLFPQFEFQRNKKTLASAAEFYIGVSGLVPPQSLSILFQLAEGTANPLVEKPDPHIHWSYLRKNCWTDFAESDIQDSTNELLDSGIIVLAIPSDATKDNTLLDTGYYWIRAAVETQCDAVCRLQMVAAQAMLAVFADRGNSSAFPGTTLPAGTISKLEVPEATVKAIKQPYPSFGGRGNEQSQAFFTRVSERLRHKDRAICLWDYERLILNEFPEIFRVKCLNHTHFEATESGAVYRELAPGHVTIVAIPNLQEQHKQDPLKPFTSLSKLDEIKEFLASRTSCFAQMHVKNPQFEEVRVRFKVRLFDGFDETYFIQQLQQAITQFLSPWAFANGSGAPTFGGKIYKSALINFVEDQSYVDFVTDFEMFQDILGVKGTTNLDEAQGSTAISVLVSAAASKHEIAVIDPEQTVALQESCACET